jgi:hypothetical protein
MENKHKEVEEKSRKDNKLLDKVRWLLLLLFTVGFV